MGLYLGIFDEEDELDGIDVGFYSDFAFFRNYVTKELEEGIAGAKYPTLILHSDSDGEWTPTECKTLKSEILEISNRFKLLPAIQFQTEWQQQVARLLGLNPKSLYDSFIDVDGEPLLERLQCLCDVAIQNNRAILLQ